jgi:L-gulonolactone oxidase
LYST